MSNDRDYTGSLKPESVVARAEQMCGQPVSSGLKTPDRCPKCKSLKNTRRKCLRCDAWIIPGCKVMFTCKACLTSKSSMGS